jgi:hypothetical protein
MMGWRRTRSYHVLSGLEQPCFQPCLAFLHVQRLLGSSRRCDMRQLYWGNPAPQCRTPCCSLGSRSRAHALPSPSLWIDEESMNTSLACGGERWVGRFSVWVGCCLLQELRAPNGKKTVSFIISSEPRAIFFPASQVATRKSWEWVPTKFDRF